MEKKNIFEKLGLIEKAENKGQVDSGQADNIQVEIKSEDMIEKVNIMDAEKPKLQKIMADKTMIKKDVKNNNVNNAVECDPIEIINKRKLLYIEDIYMNYDIKTEGINSLSIIENFKRALPDYLPADVKRQSILNIIASSYVNIDSLINDGKGKLECLDDFLNSSTSESDLLISDFEKGIDNLNEKINNYKICIDNIKKMHKEQEYIVKYEIERLNDILEFVNPVRQN